MKCTDALNSTYGMSGGFGNGCRISCVQKCTTLDILLKNLRLTVRTHSGNNSRRSSWCVTALFRWRYVASCHNPKAWSSDQNFLYRANRFLKLPGSASAFPTRKSGSISMTQGPMRQWGQ